MTVLPVQFQLPAAIVEGLINGTLVRYGGTIRKAAGQPGAGQIVTFLREGLLDEKFLETVSAFSPHFQAARMVVDAGQHHVTRRLIDEGFKQTHKMLGQVMGLSAIGAGASVLNLGLSAAGFYVMNKKLNALQRSSNELKQLSYKTLESLDAVEQKLDALHEHVIELRFLALEHSEALDDILDAVFDIQKSQEAKHYADLRVCLDRFERGDWKERSGYNQLHDSIRRVRYSWEHELAARRLDPVNDPRRFMNTLSIFRGWALASDLEILLARRGNKSEAAANISNDLAAQAREWTSTWTEQLFPTTEGLPGVSGFSHSSFGGMVMEEESRRLFTAQTGEMLTKQEMIRRGESGALAIANQFGRLPDQRWRRKQIGLLQIVDMLEETTERMEGRAAEAAFCHESYLDFDEWENVQADEHVVFEETHLENLQT